VATIPLDNNEGVFSIAVVPWAARNGELTLVVGTASETTVMPRTCKSGFLRTYTFTEDGRGLELLHKVGFLRRHKLVEMLIWDLRCRLRWMMCRCH